MAWKGGSLDQDKVKGKSIGKILAQVSLVVRGGALEELCVAVLMRLFVVLGTNKGLFQHQTLAGIAAGHDIYRTRGKVIRGRGLVHFFGFFLIVVSVHEGKRGTTLVASSEGWGREDIERDNGLGFLRIQTVQSHDSGGSSGTDGAGIDCLDLGRVEGRSLSLLDSVLSNQTGDVRHQGRRGRRQVSSQLRGFDIGDQEGQ